MCGICGVLDYDGYIDRDCIVGMTSTIEHRGPDSSGVYVSGPIALGHARLSIIDLSNQGNQPMHSDNCRYTLIYNGETYNYIELKRDLVEHGVTFNSNSDTEVVLNSFLLWGEEAFTRLKGMFSLALWDNYSETLYLVRDYFGIKPLYLSYTKNGLVFGSEIKSILASGKNNIGFNFDALHEFLYYGASLGEKTMFDGIYKLLPGHFIKIDRTGFFLVNYSKKYQTHSNFDCQETATKNVHKYLSNSVKRHLASDVPVGIFLSGGIDSSSITALASQYYGGQVKTYTVGFDYSKGAGDIERARLVAQQFNTEHHEIHIAGDDVVDVIEKLIECHDEPFSDAANIPLYMLCRELRGDIKVVLQGDGGDEIFAGYRRYNVLSNAFAWQLLAHVAVPFGRFLPKSPKRDRYMRFLQALNTNDPSRRAALLLTEESVNRSPCRLLSDATKEIVLKQNPFERYEEIYSHFAHLDPVQSMLNVDCNIILPDIFLEKVDKATMAHGIEVRVPMLDMDLVNYVMGLPSGFKVKRGQKKWLLRKAMRGTVPDEILDSPKTGFSVPYSKWLAGPLADYLRSVLLDSSSLSWGLFDKEKLDLCIEEHADHRRNNGFILYKLLNLFLWRNKYLN